MLGARRSGVLQALQLHTHPAAIAHSSFLGFLPLLSFPSFLALLVAIAVAVIVAFLALVLVSIVLPLTVHLHLPSIAILLLFRLGIIYGLGFRRLLLLFLIIIRRVGLR